MSDEPTGVEYEVDPLTGAPVLPSEMKEVCKESVLITLALGMIQLLRGGKFDKKELANDLDVMVQPLIQRVALDNEARAARPEEEG